MSYERSPIADSNSAIPTAAPIQMREEREIDPYASAARALKAAATPPIGQQTINSETVNATEAPVVPAESVTLSPQMAALARKEQKFRQSEQALKAKEVALEAERAEIAELKAFKAKLAAKDFSGIESQVPYDDYTKYLIEKSEKLTPEQETLRALQAKVDGVEKAHKDDISKRFEAAVNERRKAVTELVETKPEFASIKKAKAHEAVVQHILDTWEHDNIDLSPEEAAKEVAQELKERANSWKAILDEEAPPAGGQKQLPPLKPGLKTLTNNMAATGEIKRPVKSFQNMTDVERYAEARRRAEEKLKQQGR